MATYKNETKGARPLHLTGGGYKLIEAGATFEIEEARVAKRAMAPGIRKVKGDAKLPKPSASAVAAVTGKAAPKKASKAPAKRKAPAKPKA